MIDIKIFSGGSRVGKGQAGVHLLGTITELYRAEAWVMRSAERRKVNVHEMNIIHSEKLKNHKNSTHTKIKSPIILISIFFLRWIFNIFLTGVGGP